MDPSVDANSSSAHATNARKAPLWALAIGTWFGAGLSPKAPGTVGSLASLVVWAPMILLETAPWLRLAVTAVIFLVGTVAAEAVVRGEGRQDPQKVVVDEVAGMGVTLALSMHGAWSLALGFVLFRVFDIWKPWPVRLADRRVHGGFGVMLDDVVAGVYALGCLWIIERWALPVVLRMIAGTEVSS